LLAACLSIQLANLNADGLGIRRSVLFGEFGITIEIGLEATDQEICTAFFIFILVALQKIPNVDLIEKFLFHSVFIW
jgi:hypothetical protein